MLLAKHPVAHRGDVRVVQAVDPRSRYNGRLLVDNYVNVVVFSQQGSRPLPNMLSGSDLVSGGPSEGFCGCWGQPAAHCRAFFGGVGCM